MTIIPAAYVSTERPPPPEHADALVTKAWERFRGDTAGESSQVYPALARVPSDLFRRLRGRRHRPRVRRRRGGLRIGMCHNFRNQSIARLL
jgi:hypothetical protein